MEISNVSFKNFEKLAGEDLCARSALAVGPTSMYQVIYTRNPERLLEFYSNLLGKENLRFNSDEISAFQVGDSEIVIQAIEGDSPFKRLCGKQNLGLTVNDDKLLLKGNRLMTKKRQLKRVSKFSEKQLWKDQVNFVSDPDGNTLSFVRANLKK